VPDAGRRERARRERAIARLAVARDRAEQEAEQRAGGAVRQRAVPRHALAPAQEARAEHIVGTAARHRSEHALEVSRVVLSVAVEVDGGGVAVVAGQLQTRAEGGAEAA